MVISLTSVQGTVADLGFVKGEFKVWAKPTLVRKRAKLEGPGATPPEKFCKYGCFEVHFGTLWALGH